MLELAEDEQQAFIEDSKKRVLDGLKASKRPTFTLVLGAQGVGKSSLTTRFENAAVISPDAYVADYYAAVGADPRDNPYDREIGDFAMRVTQEILTEAVRRKYDIVYDAMSMSDAGRLVGGVKSLGYGVALKAVVNDMYASALNVEERKLRYDEDYTNYACRNGAYPHGNPLEVDSGDSIIRSMEMMDFLEKADKKGVKIEVYRTGEKEPAFVTGQGGDFAAFAETVAVGDKSGNMERCCKLVRKAINAGKEDAVMRLKRLERELSGR